MKLTKEQLEYVKERCARRFKDYDNLLLLFNTLKWQMKAAKDAE